MDTSIKKIESSLFRVPLTEVLTDAKHGDHTHFELVTVCITLADGSSGTGYTYTGGKGGYSIKAMIDRDFVPALLGKDGADIDGMYDFMEWHIHYVGRGGIASFAMSAIDISLWDIRCKRAVEPLWKVIGGSGNTCLAYRGGIDLQYSQEKLLRSIESYLEKGFNGNNHNWITWEQ